MPALLRPSCPATAALQARHWWWTSLQAPTSQVRCLSISWPTLRGRVLKTQHLVWMSCAATPTQSAIALNNFVVYCARSHSAHTRQWRLESHCHISAQPDSGARTATATPQATIKAPRGHVVCHARRYVEEAAAAEGGYKGVVQDRQQRKVSAATLVLLVPACAPQSASGQGTHISGRSSTGASMACD